MSLIHIEENNDIYKIQGIGAESHTLRSRKNTSLIACVIRGKSWSDPTGSC
jgi:hypothetical protein